MTQSRSVLVGIIAATALLLAVLAWQHLAGSRFVPCGESPWNADGSFRTSSCPAA